MVGMVLLMVTGCAPAATASSAPGSASSVWTVALTSAVRAGSDSGCRQNWTPDVAARICTALLATERSDFTATPAGGDRITYRWRLQAGEHDVVQTVTTTLRDGRADAVGGGGQIPLWARESATRQVRGELAAYGTCAPDLLDRMGRARDAVSDAGLGELASGWSGAVVVECPASAEGYAAVTGMPLSAGSGVAASAWPLGSAVDKPVHLVLNPAVAVTGGDLDLLLRHEIVHVATHSYTWHVTWITEGLADAVAADDAYRAASDAAVRADAAAHGIPARLPADADFADPATSNLRYGYARLAVDVLRREVGWPRARAALAVWATGDSRAVDGVTQDDLLAWWQAALR